jgi:hypothetical protein
MPGRRGGAHGRWRARGAAACVSFCPHGHLAHTPLASPDAARRCGQLRQAKQTRSNRMHSVSVPPVVQIGPSCFFFRRTSVAAALTLVEGELLVPEHACAASHASCGPRTCYRTEVRRRKRTNNRHPRSAVSALYLPPQQRPGRGLCGGRPRMSSPRSLRGSEHSRAGVAATCLRQPPAGGGRSKKRATPNRSTGSPESAGACCVAARPEAAGSAPPRPVAHHPTKDQATHSSAGASAATSAYSTAPAQSACGPKTLSTVTEASVGCWGQQAPRKERGQQTGPPGRQFRKPAPSHEGFWCHGRRTGGAKSVVALLVTTKACNATPRHFHFSLPSFLPHAVSRQAWLRRAAGRLQRDHSVAAAWCVHRRAGGAHLRESAKKVCLCRAACRSCCVTTRLV